MRVVVACAGLLLVLFAPLSANVVIGEGDLLQDVSLQTGQELQLAVAANPTTGYQWTCTWTPAACLRLARDEYVAGAGEGRVGTGGTHFFTLVGQAAGEVRVDLQYARPWAGGEQGLPRLLVLQIVPPPQE